MFDLKNENTIKELFKDVQLAQEKSYSPYSKFRVGAVIYTKDGNKIYGANIENSSYGLTICAERTCMFNMHLQGYKAEDCLCLALVGDSSTYAYPCGACRQVMLELLDMDCPVIIFGKNGDYIISSVRELSPLCFAKENLD